MNWDWYYAEGIDIDAVVAGMSNEDLVQQTVGLAGGDDYDGCFTPEGRKAYIALTSELNKRLKTAGFIQQDVFEEARDGCF